MTPSLTHQRKIARLDEIHSTLTEVLTLLEDCDAALGDLYTTAFDGLLEAENEPSPAAEILFEDTLDAIRKSGELLNTVAPLASAVRDYLHRNA